jgi:hypothetical protein
VSGEQQGTAGPDRSEGTHPLLLPGKDLSKAAAHRKGAESTSLSRGSHRG